MLEYVFFHPEPCERFVRFLEQVGQVPELEQEEGVWEVRLPETVADDVLERIEAQYDELLELNQQLHDETAAKEDYHAAGVVLSLSSGETVYAQVEPALLSRIMSVLTPEEFGRVVEAIVDAVEHPDSRTLCQRVKES
jgi:hypothetical protein